MIHNSGATSGSPFSIIEVAVGIVAPGTSSTSQPYPFSNTTLSIWANISADAQSISATVIEPQSDCATFFSEHPANPSAIPRNKIPDTISFFDIFIFNP